MTPLSERLLHLLHLAGPSGISGDDLFGIIYDGATPRYQGGNKQHRERTALKALIWQLNQELAHDGLRIVGEKCAGGWYRLVKRSGRSHRQSASAHSPSR
jgi:hypothetical protein